MENDSEQAPMQSEVFISYAWGGESERIAEEIENALATRHSGLNIIRDKNELAYKGQIKDFMRRIGKGRYVIVIISDKYLKSQNCMFELLEIASNGQFYRRIFPVVLADADIYDPINLLDYVEYWENKATALDEKMKKVSSANLQGIRDSIDLYTKIREMIARLTDTLKDMNTLTPDMHEARGFEDLYQALSKTMAEDEAAAAPLESAPRSQHVPSEPCSPQSQREAYLRSMRVEWCSLPLEVLDPNASDPNAHRLTLEKVYVSLDTATPRPDKLKQNTPEERRDKPLSAVESLLLSENRRMVLLGQPGSGKSTFARYLCLALADVLLNPGSDLAGRLADWQGPALMPVLVSLRRFAADGKQPGSSSRLASFIHTQLDQYENLRGFGKLLLTELKESGGVVVFDGLDEVAADCRIPVKQSLIEFANEYPRCLILATCRVYSYRQEASWRLPWEDHTLAEFDPAKIRQFIDSWYGALAALNPSGSVDYLGKGGKAETLKGIFDPDDPRGLLDLAGTPLLLTVMAIVHAHKELPGSRVGVYRECVNILLLRWQGAREGAMKGKPLLDALSRYGVTDQKLQKGLHEVAYQAHHSGESRRGSGNRALVSEEIIRGYMHKWLEKDGNSEGLEEFIRYCRHANGLLLTERVEVDQDEGVSKAWYVFPHLTFQEYLAAMHWVDQFTAQDDLKNGLKQAVERAGDPAWWEVSRFLGEHFCHDEYSSNQIFAKALLEKLCPVAHPKDDAAWRRVWLAGALLPGWRKETPQEDQDDSLIQRINGRLVELLNAEPPLRDDMPARAAVGRVLAAVGDPRPGVDIQNLPTREGRERAENDGLPHVLWMPIPGTAKVKASGLFPQFTGLRLGTGAKPDPQAFSNEKWPAGKEPLEISDFELAAYPVTVAQFRPFVEHGAYQQDRYWSEQGKLHRDRQKWNAPRYWDDRAWTVANHPVVGVSWYEAEAYCNWLNAHSPAGQSVRLPTEAEWEWAARGPEGLIYPWDDEWQVWRCNGESSGIGRTSAVGCFPGGAATWWKRMDATAARVYDLSGNVWEWTGSKYSDDYAMANL